MAYARRLDRDQAMDIVQEAFLRLWRAWEAGETILSPRAWLLRVARNLAEDTAKSAFHRNGTSPVDWLYGIAGRSPMPVQQLERAETLAQIRQLLADLPTDDRDILTLRYALDYDTNQIAELLGIQVTAVHMRLSRARKRLADRLAEQGVTSLP
ncbi:sigma-70 family rna polymerase sigma factor : RNA polymerase sigma-70 factor, ECF subfamily OS=uncultured planctomycete GN=HGMM_F01A04C14 PE=4 SV=1: Sigma70_r2: Sigma70_r4_2 [Tuwongella immobilis]|uniref:RNA polymerase sigma factor 70 region 4 type 2 domain-containing protein n=2 Tax=Tuwongella immobilis TaxID=692036 RepID=A0A6C2YUI0_9BACT|nr:sigma-70 family rna polymerase sigma factor : RNA polymerase sigma-70 factor, ECF subfamily OS=uncultured planctomycete GN=HGMM_F01A04C14 PE=4 SV=1: Sigma70_r2: Sigma70_r4_2 [Tuwongella immobilis]VTS06405.1 sigma-70 family rna polymerase sigma factor : RNA polymerase sigma-70 factor, ECF subfamily OS=uncultured planctomycete GN=HGMM_F01A04C14 PE=4 SV=1: Sigma70_r2: Sigma70_r4_2 [Tuwongella immobilis]